MEDMKSVFKQAADIAKELPDNMQEAGFLRAVDVLLAQHGLAPDQAVEPARRRRAGKKTARGRSGTTAKKTARKSTRRRSGRVGSQTALRELAENSTFFSSPRTIADIQTHLDNRKALKFKQNELSGPLGKLVRAGVLDRERNKDNLYAYKIP